jgi:uncharacterized paraquat-inducible protein A
MIEVFLLGLLVAMVKLASMATVIPGIALWAFGALTIALTATLSFDPRRLWARGALMEPDRRTGRPDGLPRAAATGMPTASR